MKVKLFSLFVILFLLMSSVGIQTARAASLVVNSTDDIDDGACNATHCSLREAVNYAASGDTITFSVSGTITLTSQITFDNKTLTITGPGSSTLAISGNLVSRIFNIGANGILNLSDVTLQGGYPASSTGGAINAAGQVTLDNVILNNNIAVTGGAIYSTNNLTISRSAFNWNTANNGGAIYSVGSVMLDSVLFAYNSANGEGGAIYFNSLGTLSVDDALQPNNSTFVKNQAGKTGAGTGGAISVQTASSFSVVDTVFTQNSVQKAADNSANGNGGAIFIGTTVTSASISNSTFDSNFAMLGGGICTVQSLTASGLTFINNQADPNVGMGGGLYVDVVGEGPASLTNSVFTGNTADRGGGLMVKGGIMTAEKILFSQNGATDYGGGAFVQAALTLSNATFSNNESKSQGGGILVTGGTLNLVNTTLNNNTAVSGGNFYSSGTATIKNTLMIAGASGGNCNGAPLNAASVGNMADDATCGANFAVKTAAQIALGGLTGMPAYYPLLPGSSAIDAGDDASCASTDQRGMTRPQGAHCDIGAYEANATITLKSTGAQDGWILESTEASKLGGTLDSAAITFRLGDDATKKQYRGLLSFSTGASLPDNAVITKITLKVKRQGVTGGGNPVTMFQGFMADIKKGFFGTTALQTSDFQAKATKSYGPFTPALSGGWYSIDLTSGKAYINKLSALSGLTQIRLRFSLDDNNNAVANYLSFFSGNAPAASRPQLIVEYYVPVP
jgi:CSLREA domain-containing protein